MFRYFDLRFSACIDLLATVVWNEGAQSWVKLFTNHGSSCYKKSWVKLLYNLDQIEAADHNQIVVISYSDSDCDPPLVQQARRLVGRRGGSGKQ